MYPIRPGSQLVTTFRVHKRGRFTTIDRRTVNDDTLSFRARGILVWLLDKPDDWTATRESIASASPDGVTAIRPALKELTDHGYLVRTKVRLPNGQTVTETHVHEVPPEVGNPPLAIGPEVGNQPADNQPAVPQPVIDRRLKQKTSADKPQREESPFAQTADDVTRTEWNRRGKIKPVCGYPALRARILEALDAGHSAESIANALPSMIVFTRNAFDFALNQRQNGNRRPPPTPPAEPVGRNSQADWDAEVLFWAEKAEAGS